MRQTLASLFSPSAVMLIALLLPAQTFAGICLNATMDSGDEMIIKFTVAGQAEEFFNLLGEGIHTVGCASSESAPLNGSAHARSDGQVHFGVTITGTLSCDPIMFEGLLTPPSYNSGTGTFDILNGGFGNATFNAVACPPLPQ